MTFSSSFGLGVAVGGGRHREGIGGRGEGSGGMVGGTTVGGSLLMDSVGGKGPSTELSARVPPATRGIELKVSIGSRESGLPIIGPPIIGCRDGPGIIGSRGWSIG